MLIIILVSFLVIFALVMVAVSVGWNFVEAQRKKKVMGMLEVAAGGEPAPESTLLKETATEGGDGLDRVLNRFNLVRKLTEHIQQAGLEWTAGRVLLMTVAGVVIGALLGIRFRVLMFQGLSMAALALLFGSLPYLYVMRKRAKRLGQFEEQFPEALDFLARAMRAGHAFSVSLEMLADESPEPLALEFRKVFNEQNLGAPIEVALQNLSVRIPIVDVRFFVSSVMLQKETGGNLAEILTKLAYVIRERFRLKGQVKAASAHGRITGTILTIMPIVMVFALSVVAPGYLEGMAKDPDGKWLIVGAIVGQFLGYFFIRKIINIKV